ncbi:MAG: histidine phosphatase family protein [Phycisphaeraceae bacterium]|nr:histidine phosphatase family protein [Phycisphaeraceae bacterium]MBX3367842.1 histidine phosphatase family protein [Phycisphaeraceae bacterium]
MPRRPGALRASEPDECIILMAKVTDIQILIARCGPTAWDEGGRLCGGGTDLPVCPAGHEHLQSIGERLSGSTLGVVVCGPDAASHETARVIAAATGARVKSADDLGEVSLGLWEGLLVGELEERFPTVYRQWKDDPTGLLVPQGESVDEARERLISALARLLNRTRGVGKGVGVVLRPISYLIVRSWLRGEGLAESWQNPSEVPPLEWHCVPKLRIRRDGAETLPGPAGSRAKAS